ncbi:hypothetical protein HYX13_05015, partial [Candidatus Woesearchaeota archaeon]|nr:hypothetical protein [Candidatus Woesearchaeota archaeon]
MKKNILLLLTLIFILSLIFFSCQPKTSQQQVEEEIEQRPAEIVEKENQKSPEQEIKISFPPTQITTYASPSNP